MEPMTEQATECRYCGRRIVWDPRSGWVDPEATGDDGVWRETCDAHDTFTAEHEPEPDEPEFPYGADSPETDEVQ